MIKLTRLNGSSFYLNALLIETIESFPDTTILLTNGKRYVVKEDEQTVVELVHDFYRHVQILNINQMKEDRDGERS